jgi:hypothetical protein
MSLARDGETRLALAGGLLIGVAIVHAVFGVWFGRLSLGAMFSDGLVASVDSRGERGLVFWFLLMSPLLLLIGQLCVFLAERGIAPPRWLGFEVLLLTVACALLMPVSGFWLLLPPAALLLRASAVTR